MRVHPLEAVQPALTPAHTPGRGYHVRLSDREIQSLRYLLSRNFGGLSLGVVNEFLAAAKAVKQICDTEDDTLDNYD